MRVFLTGGTSPLGSAVAAALRARGDAVRALVRDPDRATALQDLGCELVAGDVLDEPRLVALCRGTSAVVHCASVTQVGAPPGRRAALVDGNVCSTERVLGAALSAGVPRAVHVSSIAVFGDTRGAVADEGWVRTSDGYTSVYEETRVLAHRRAQQLGERGLPLVTVHLGAVYGSGERSPLGELLEHFLAGRLPALPFPTYGLAPVHRDDAAAGIVRALDQGVAGEAYVLAGDPVRLRELLAALAEVSGRRPPRLEVPTSLLRALAPAGRYVGPSLGFPPNLRELVASCAGVTFWARADKAAHELGWRSRPLHEGLRELVETRG